MPYKFKLTTASDSNIRITARMPIGIFNKDIQDIVRQHTRLNSLNYTYINSDITEENGHRIIFYIPTKFTRITNILTIYLPNKS